MAAENEQRTCICQICQCGRHRCPHIPKEVAVSRPVDRGNVCRLLATYANAYSCYPNPPHTAAADWLKQKQMIAYEELAYDRVRANCGNSNRATVYQVAAERSVPYSCRPPSDYQYPVTTYVLQFPKKYAGQAMQFKPAFTYRDKGLQCRAAGAPVAFKPYCGAPSSNVTEIKMDYTTPQQKDASSSKDQDQSSEASKVNPSAKCSGYPTQSPYRPATIKFSDNPANVPQDRCINCAPGRADKGQCQKVVPAAWEETARRQTSPRFQDVKPVVIAPKEKGIYWKSGIEDMPTTYHDNYSGVKPIPVTSYDHADNKPKTQPREKFTSANKYQTKPAGSNTGHSQQEPVPLFTSYGNDYADRSSFYPHTSATAEVLARQTDYRGDTPIPPTPPNSDPSSDTCRSASPYSRGQQSRKQQAQPKQKGKAGHVAQASNRKSPEVRVSRVTSPNQETTAVCICKQEQQQQTKQEQEVQPSAPPPQEVLSKNEAGQKPSIPLKYPLSQDDMIKEEEDDEDDDSTGIERRPTPPPTSMERLMQTYSAQFENEYIMHGQAPPKTSRHSLAGKQHSFDSSGKANAEPSKPSINYNSHMHGLNKNESMVVNYPDSRILMTSKASVGMSKPSFNYNSHMHGLNKNDSMVVNYPDSRILMTSQEDGVAEDLDALFMDSLRRQENAQQQAKKTMKKPGNPDGLSVKSNGTDLATAGSNLDQDSFSTVSTLQDDSMPSIYSSQNTPKKPDAASNNQQTNGVQQTKAGQASTAQQAKTGPVSTAQQANAGQNFPKVHCRVCAGYKPKSGEQTTAQTEEEMDTKSDESQTSVKFVNTVSFLDSDQRITTGKLKKKENEFSRVKRVPTPPPAIMLDSDSASSGSSKVVVSSPPSKTQQQTSKSSQGTSKITESGKPIEYPNTQGTSSSNKPRISFDKKVTRFADEELEFYEKIRKERIRLYKSSRYGKSVLKQKPVVHPPVTFPTLRAPTYFSNPRHRFTNLLDTV